MNKYAIALSALIAGAGLMAAAEASAAQRGYATTELNLRAGPSKRYPALDLIPAGDSLTIHGCISRYRWCDVSYEGHRGWASGAYLQMDYEGRHVYVPEVAPRLKVIPVINFNIRNYWEENYHDRDFYTNMDDWINYNWDDDPVPDGWDSEWDEDY